MKKRILSLALILCMLIVSVPGVSVVAETQPESQSVSMGCSNSAAVKNDGSLWMWGYNSYGQIGNGESGFSKEERVPVKIMDNVKAVSLGDNHSAAIKNDGSLWLWGNNEYGRVGNGEYRYGKKSKTPVKIMDNVKAVSLGGDHSAAIKNDGSLWMWGNNEYGQIGNGESGDDKISVTPIKIMDNVTTVSLGDGYSAAIKNDGSLWLWGNNEYGQIGNGESGDDKISKIPIKIMDNVKVVSLSCSQNVEPDYTGNHSAAIKKDGSLWMWGYNGCGQIGNGESGDGKISEIPVKVMDNVKDVSLGSLHSAAIKEDGSLWMWGHNYYGQLGNGERGAGDDKISGKPVKIMDNVKDVSLGSIHSAAIKEDGSLWMWGNGGLGKLGNGSTADWSFTRANLCIPIKVMDDVKVSEINEKPISVYLNDKKIEFDVPPVIEEGRTLVPLRAIFEAMGMIVDWDGTTSTITAAGKGNSISMRVNETTATVNGKTLTMDVPSKVIEGRTLVPVRFIAESLGAEVDWDGENRIVYISYDPNGKIFIRVKDEKQGAFTSSGTWLFAKPWQYTSIEVVDTFGKPITDKTQYKITLSNSFVTLDENLTLSVRAEDGICNMKLYDHQGQQNDVRIVSIIKEPIGAKFIWDNTKAHETLTDNFYSFELWDDYQEEDGWMWTGAALSNFWSNPIDYWGEVNYQKLMTAVLTDALINDAAVASMNQQLEDSYINSKIDEYDVWINALESGAEWQSKQVQSVIEDMKLERDSLLRHIEMPQLSAEQIDEIVKKTYQDYFDEIVFQNVDEFARYSELLEQQSGRKVRADKVAKAMDRIGIGMDILTIATDSLTEYHTLCALADVRDKYVNGLNYLAEYTVVPEVKAAVEDVVEMMDKGFADGLAQVVKEAGWSFVQTELGQKVAGKVLAKGAEYILPKLGIGAAKTAEIVGKIGSTAKDIAKGWIWVEIANWVTEAAVGAETGSNACFDLRALMHIQRELKSALNEMATEMRDGRNDYIEEYLMVASLMKPVAIYASHLNRVICNAQDNGAVKKFMRYMQKDEVYQDNYDRLYEAEVSKIGNATFVY